MIHKTIVILFLFYNNITEKYFDDRDNRQELTAHIRLIRDNLHQAVINVEHNGVYYVPRFATHLIVPLLNHENLRWFTIDLNKRKSSGTAVYADYLKTALNQVRLVFSETYYFLLAQKNRLFISSKEPPFFNLNSIG